MREMGYIYARAEMSAVLCLVMLSELKLITVRSTKEPQHSHEINNALS